MDEFYRRLCLKYLIGSTAIFGRVDRDALRVLRESCGAEGTRYLADLLLQLAEANNRDTVARFIANNTEYSDCTGFLRSLVAQLMRKYWDAMNGLIMKVLFVLEGDRTRTDTYHFILRHLPIKRQYEMISAGKVPLDIIDSVYFIGSFDWQLRELFALARCSYVPNSELREYIANRDHRFRQFLPDCATKTIVFPCPDHIPKLDNDAWRNIFMFLDVESLVVVLPLVCRTWQSLYPSILTQSTKVHDLYMQDLTFVKLLKVHQISPWKYCLLNRSSALKYLGCCIADGVLDRVEPRGPLESAARKYLRRVRRGKVPIPRIRDAVSVYDSFLMLFEAVYRFCTHQKPRLVKPEFFSREEYEQMVHHFVYGRRWTLELSRSLVIHSMPRLFSIINEDEELMKRLVLSNFYDFLEASISLILYGQTHEMSEKLARLIFSQTDAFVRFVEPELVHPSSYYSLIVEHNILPELTASRYWMLEFTRLFVLIVLSFKNSPDTVDRIVSSIVDKFLGFERSAVMDIGSWFEKELFRISRDSCEHSPQDVIFLKETMARIGWTSGLQTRQSEY